MNHPRIISGAGSPSGWSRRADPSRYPRRVRPRRGLSSPCSLGSPPSRCARTIAANPRASRRTCPRAHGERRVSAEEKSARRDVEHEDEDGHHREDATQLGVAGEFETAAETQGVVERAAPAGGAEGRSARVGSMQAGVRSRRLEEGTSRARVELAVRVALVVFRLVGGTGVPRVAVGAGTAVAGLAAAVRESVAGAPPRRSKEPEPVLLLVRRSAPPTWAAKCTRPPSGAVRDARGTSSSSWTRRGGCPPDSPRRASMDSSPPRSARAHAAAVRSVDDAISREPPPGRTPGGREEEEASASRANAERRAIAEVTTRTRERD